MNGKQVSITAVFDFVCLLLFVCLFVCLFFVWFVVFLGFLGVFFRGGGGGWWLRAFRLTLVCLALKRDTEAENRQSVEKQVLQACSQFMFEWEASVASCLRSRVTCCLFNFLEDRSGRTTALYSLEACNFSDRKICKG